MPLSKFTGYALFVAMIVMVLIAAGCSNTTDNTAKSSEDLPVPDANVRAESSSTSKEDDAGPCENAFYPVGGNIKRTYRITYPQNVMPPREYTESFSDIAADGFYAVTDLGSSSTKLRWRCSDAGLFATQYNNSIDLKDSGTANIETLEADGISFPAENRWKVGEKWSATYRVKQSIKTGDNTLVTDASGDVKQAAEIVGEEDVAVPAGNFKAFKVKVASDLDISLNIGGNPSVPIRSQIVTYAWFAKDIGMVKSTTSLGKQATVVTELLSFKK